LSLRITVAVALVSVQEVIELELPEGSRVADALAAARVDERFPNAGLAEATVGIWSRPCGRHTVLRDGDRVELYRPLVVDPKQARRARARTKR